MADLKVWEGKTSSGKFADTITGAEHFRNIDSSGLAYILYCCNFNLDFLPAENSPSEGSETNDDIWPIFISDLIADRKSVV